jgi:hypothetical protein
MEDITSFPTSAPGPTSEFLSIQFDLRDRVGGHDYIIRRNQDWRAPDRNPTIVVSCENGAFIEYVTSYRRFNELYRI